MKRIFALIAAFSLMAGCIVDVPWEDPDIDDPTTDEPSEPVEYPIKVDDPINISSPTPTEQLTKVDLNATEQGYVEAGDRMAFRFLKEMYEGKNLILSPLSLQYALAMTANGASGETLQEIIDFLGYGNEGIDALNAYCKKMLEQLPALDLDVTLKLTDAILVNKNYPLYQDFKKTVEENYYAAVENMDFSNPQAVADRINEWAFRNTYGFIDKVISADEISPAAVAFLMNALYFKAKWAGSQYDPMFDEAATTMDVFTRSDNSKTQVNYMRNTRYHQYAEMDGFSVLALPYAGEKFYMYILLPDKNDLESLIKKLPDISWNKILSSFNDDAEVELRLPKFDIEERYELADHLQALGIQKAFTSAADFDRMFQASNDDLLFHISKVVQKAKISVAEWGTVAAAVTVVTMEKNAFPGEEVKRIKFYADHPFIYIIGEATTGAILFEGAFTGE